MVVVPRESPGGTVAFKVGLGVRQILGILGGLVQFHGSHAEFVFVASGSVLMQREKNKNSFPILCVNGRLILASKNFREMLKFYF